LIEIAKKINSGILTREYKLASDSSFKEVFDDYTNKLDKIATEILSMGRIEAFFFNDPLLEKLMELKAWNLAITVWLKADFQKTLARDTE